MKQINLNSNEIISSSHETLHDINALKLYYRIYSKGCEKIAPPSPIIHKDFVVKYFSDKTKAVFQEYQKFNPDAKYFLLDGSHRTTAAVLAGKKINCFTIENNNDITKALSLEKVGELIKFDVGKNITDVIRILAEHFNKNNNFQTVKEKTVKLAESGIIPPYMIK